MPAITIDTSRSNAESDVSIHPGYIYIYMYIDGSYFPRVARPVVGWCFLLSSTKADGRQVVGEVSSNARMRTSTNRQKWWKFLGQN
jgi:hypothetical protein